MIYKSSLDEEESKKLINEVEILKELVSWGSRRQDHPNILKLHEFFQDKKRYYIVTELCQGGELFEKITKKTMFSEKDAV